MTISEEAIAVAAAASPLRRAGDFSPLADLDELRFREEVESYEDPAGDVVAWIERKELPYLFSENLKRAGLEPSGTIVDLGAGTCWLSSMLARRSSVDRVISIEFSERRISEYAPVAIAYLGAPPAKIERVVADFYAHGLDNGIADWVVIDAAFHHAADPVRLAKVAYDLLRPGGAFLLHREPVLSPWRRSRKRTFEDEHGDFERVYRVSEYLRFLEAAGFSASRHPAVIGTRTLRGRLQAASLLRWLNGIAYSAWTFVGRMPDPSRYSQRPVPGLAEDGPPDTPPDA